MTQVTDQKAVQCLEQSEVHEIVLFGLKLIDEHAIRCSGLLNSLWEEKQMVEESVDHMRSQWISYSIRKHEQQMVQADAKAWGVFPGKNINHNVGESSSSNVVGRNKMLGELRVASGKLVLEPRASNKEDEFYQDHPGTGGVGTWPNFDAYMDIERDYVLTPDERDFYATPADPAVLRGPPLFDVTPISAPPVHAVQQFKFGDEGEGSEEDFDGPVVPEDFENIAMNSHSSFGASPFTLGVFHANTPLSVCRNVIKMVEKTDAVEGRR